MATELVETLKLTSRSLRQLKRDIQEDIDEIQEIPLTGIQKALSDSLARIRSCEDLENELNESFHIYQIDDIRTVDVPYDFYSSESLFDHYKNDCYRSCRYITEKEATEFRNSRLSSNTE